MTFQEIITGALDPNIVQAIASLDRACDDSKSARRFIITNALLFIRQQKGFETKITKALMDEAFRERAMISPIVHAEAD